MDSERFDDAAAKLRNHIKDAPDDLPCPEDACFVMTNDDTGDLIIFARGLSAQSFRSIISRSKIDESVVSAFLKAQQN